MEQEVLNNFQKLQLTKEEADDIVITSVARAELLEECSLSLFRRLLTDHQQNQRAFKNTLKITWKMGPNLRIVERKGLMASNISFTHAPFWVQVWGLPFEYMSEDAGKDIGSRLGKDKVDGAARGLQVGKETQLEENEICLSLVGEQLKLGEEAMSNDIFKRGGPCNIKPEVSSPVKVNKEVTKEPILNGLGPSLEAEIEPISRGK
nr:hypothetical protein CFP56_25320 [Quercus suber]